MTSTITAEERAKAVHDEFFIPGSGDVALERTLIALIAAAIRDSQLSTLDRAKRYIGMPVLSTDDPTMSEGFRLGLESAQLSCEALKEIIGTEGAGE